MFQISNRLSVTAIKLNVKEILLQGGYVITRSIKET
jgi:hypothetical protein